MGALVLIHFPSQVEISHRFVVIFRRGGKRIPRKRRRNGVGLRSGTAELLTLVESDVEPLASLLLSDDDYRALVDRAEAELGEA